MRSALYSAAPRAAASSSRSDGEGTVTFISRRDLLKRAAVVGAAAVPANVGRPFQGRHNEAGGEPERLALHETALHAHEMAPREPLEKLTAAEADLLEAIVARLIPTDANGPGASEA